MATPPFVSLEIDPPDTRFGVLERTGDTMLFDQAPDAQVCFFAARLATAIDDATSAGFVVEPSALIPALNHLSVIAISRAG